MRLKKTLPIVFLLSIFTVCTVQFSSSKVHLNFNHPPVRLQVTLVSFCIPSIATIHEYFALLSLFFEDFVSVQLKSYSLCRI